MVAHVTKKPPASNSIRLLKRLLLKEEQQLSSSCSKVRRNLFGVHDSNKQEDQKSPKSYMEAFQDEYFKSRVEKASQDWNFDFAKEVPLSGGRYVWERVSSADLPSWYSSGCRLKSCEKRADVVSESESTDENEIKTTSASGLKKSSKTSNTKLLQTSLKDYARVMKKRSSMRLKLKQVQLYSCRLRNHHHHLTVHSITTC